jgi:glycosyltransferase involved in cell wall biosynthesis
MALHILALPWTDLTKAWEAEAFTARTRVMVSMLARYGRVHVYGSEVHETTGTDHVAVIDRAWQERHWPGYRTSDVFSDYDPRRAPWIEFNVRCAEAIRERHHPGDMLGLTMGNSNGLATELLADLRMPVVELGIGYKGVLPDSHKVFESYAWRMWHHGFSVGVAEAKGDPTADRFSDVRNFDTVIPRPYDLADFPAGSGTGGYFVFLGRITNRKGALVASQVCQRIGARLIVAGQNVTAAEKGKVTTADGVVLEGDVEWVGVIGPQERAKLLGDAIATFVPTLYAEPFGGCHAESLLTGTPVIATDHGCFIDYIADGVNGWRCSTMAEFVDAARRAASLDRFAIRDMAARRYGTAVVGPQYDRYLNRIASLRREGWYSLPLERVA